MRNISRFSPVSAAFAVGVVLFGSAASAQDAAKTPEMNPAAPAQAATPAPSATTPPAPVGQQPALPEEAAAEKPASATPPPATQHASVPAQAVAASVRRDPAGTKGISPLWEAVRRGDNAYVAQDFEAAAEAYRAAIKTQPNNPIGHLRLGEVLLRTGRSADAEAAWKSALRYADKDPTSKAKALFVLADLSERRRAYAEATERWHAYKDFAGSNKNAKTFPKTADDRLRRINEWQNLLKEYGAVRDRIARDTAEGDKRRKESAE